MRVVVIDIGNHGGDRILDDISRIISSATSDFSDNPIAFFPREIN